MESKSGRPHLPRCVLVALVFAVGVSCGDGEGAPGGDSPDEGRPPPGAPAETAPADREPAEGAPPESLAAHGVPGATGGERPGAGDAPAAAGSLSRIASSARGYPALRDPDGRILADGRYAQWLENDRLRVLLRYDFRDGRRIEEETAFAPGPGEAGFVQERWSWNETRDGRLLRRFEVDFRGRTAGGEKRQREEEEEEEVERWSEEIDVEPGRAFAGFGFTFALEALRDRLVGGTPVRLQAVAFTPGPRVVEVELSHAGRDRLRMADRSLTGDRFEIAPQLPFIAELFVDAPVTRIWLTLPPPEFLRFEGTLVEPSDPRVRIDLLPGSESAPAAPIDSG